MAYRSFSQSQQKPKGKGTSLRLGRREVHVDLVQLRALQEKAARAGGHARKCDRSLSHRAAEIIGKSLPRHSRGQARQPKAKKHQSVVRIEPEDPRTLENKAKKLLVQRAMDAELSREREEKRAELFGLPEDPEGEGEGELQTLPVGGSRAMDALFSDAQPERSRPAMVFFERPKKIDVNEVEKEAKKAPEAPWKRARNAPAPASFRGIQEDEKKEVERKVPKKKKIEREIERKMPKKAPEAPWKGSSGAPSSLRGIQEEELKERRGRNEEQRRRSRVFREQTEASKRKFEAAKGQRLKFVVPCKRAFAGGKWDAKRCRNKNCTYAHSPEQLRKGRKEVCCKLDQGCGRHGSRHCRWLHHIWDRKQEMWVLESLEQFKRRTGRDLGDI